MAQIRGTAQYNLGPQTSFGGPSRTDSMADPSPLDQIRQQTSKIEDFLDTLSEPVKPYVHMLFLHVKSRLFATSAGELLSPTPLDELLLF